MKKYLVPLGLLAAVGAVSAQSTVTLFGVVDATLAHGSGSVASKTQLTNSGYNSSRLGFRGTEDLGGGMSASFWLEAGMSNDDGQGAATNQNNQPSGAGAAVAGRQGLTFNRRSTVSLSGSWGEVRLGRDYTPNFWNVASYDPFGYNGVGLTEQSVNVGGVVYVRASNGIGYFLPGNLGGFFGQFMHYRGENVTGTATSDDGTGNGVRLGYAAGPINVGVAMGRTKYATGDITSSSVGGSYDMKVVKLNASITHDKVSGLLPDGRGWLLGFNAPLGVGEARGSYSSYQTDAAGTPRTRKLALGYIHNLSKRTALYATVARVHNSGGAAVGLNGAVTGANENSTGYDFGLRHAF
ncbi:MAG: gram-negative porin family protein [Ramlibacter sp.]|nr:gram-negative porin family protein [Ramlibacter sp.]